MKKIIVLALIVVSFASCKKENYICKCTKTGPGGDSQTSVNYGTDITSASAEEQCNNSEYTDGEFVNTCTVFRE